MTEETTQPAAPAGDTGPLTESAAADLLQNWRDEPEEQAPKVGSARAQANAAEEAVEAVEAALSPEAEPEAEADGDTSAEDDTEVYVDGKARTRLRDGTEVSIAELKKSFDDARDFRRQRAEFDARRQELDAKVAQSAQQEQSFASTIQQAMAALQSTLPPEPDVRLRVTDPILYSQQEWARNDALNQMARLHQANQAQAEKAQAQQASQFQERIKQEQSRLFEKIPELKNADKRREFYNDLKTIVVRDYNFTEQDIDNIYDSRVMEMARDAMAYRKLQTAKPKAVEKSKTARPVTKPGERASSQANLASKHKNLFERAKKTRSVDDVAALLSELE